jgi:hypothetical protein
MKKVLFGIVVIILIVAAWLFVWSKNSTYPLIQPTDTSNWKMYTDTKWGYTIEYPSTYLLSIHDNSIIIRDPKNNPREFGPSFEIEVRESQQFSGKTYKTAEEFARTYLESPYISLTSINKLAIPDSDSIMVSGNQTSEAPIDPDFNMIFSLHNGNEFIISWNPSDYPPFQKIASTFKFTK